MLIDAPLDHGPSQQTPKKIIVHSMGELIDDGEEHLHAVKFLDKVGLSAHMLVCPNGDLMRCRPDDKGAWHAKGHNKDSLGIEFLVPGLHDYASFIEAIKGDWLTDAAYRAGVKQLIEWKHLYGPLPIFRHSDVDPDRKVDPGAGFPWDALIDAYTEERV